MEFDCENVELLRVYIIHSCRHRRYRHYVIIITDDKTHHFNTTFQFVGINEQLIRMEGGLGQWRIQGRGVGVYSPP